MCSVENQFDYIAILNTVLGVMNFNKNDEQKRHQDVLEEKIDRIIELLDRE